MNTGTQVARSVAAIVGGYAVMVVLITVVQEGIFGGVSYASSPPGVLIGAGLLTMLCAVVGGLVAAWVAGRAYLLHAGVMAALVVVETTTLYVTGRVPGPLWFDALAAASLMAGLLAGAWLFQQARPSAARRV